jgi:hypothetical protein
MRQVVREKWKAPLRIFARHSRSCFRLANSPLIQALVAAIWSGEQFTEATRCGASRHKRVQSNDTRLSCDETTAATSAQRASVSVSRVPLGLGMFVGSTKLSNSLPITQADESMPVSPDSAGEAGGVEDDADRRRSFRGRAARDGHVRVTPTEGAGSRRTGSISEQTHIDPFQSL